jgi:hypothetical protein
MLNPATAFRDVKKPGAGWMAKCPAHDDGTASLSIGIGEAGRILLKCHAGCELDDILAAAHVELADLFPERIETKSKIVAVYPYHDQAGVHLFDAVRLDPKGFFQRRADGVTSMGGVRRVVYHLDKLQGQTVAYVAEGERDADRLWTIGLPGTTNAGGAGKWKPEYAEQLKAATVEHVVVLPDNDDPGRTHAAAVAQSCHAVGLKVKIVTLPDVPVKGDVTDWLDSGHTRDELIALVKATAIWTPSIDIPTTPNDDLCLTPLRALLDEPEDAVEWVVDGLIASASLNLLAGKPKAGKSTLARQLGFGVATGTHFLGHACVGGVVWYLVLEDKRSEVRRHFRALGATGHEQVRFLFGGTKDLLPKLTRLAERERPQLIIVDTLQRLLMAKDLNDYAEVTTRFDPVLAIARTTGAALLLVHHASKTDRGGIDAVLGSTALTGSVDNVFILARTDKYRVLSSIQRIGEDLDETVIALDEDGRVHGGQSRHAADVGFIERALVGVLTATPDLTRAEWLDAVEGRKQLKLEALRRIVDSGTTVVTGTGKRNDPFRYKCFVSGSQVPDYVREPEMTSPLLLRFPNEIREKGGSQVPAEIVCGSRANDTPNDTLARLDRDAIWDEADARFKAGWKQ